MSTDLTPAAVPVVFTPAPGPAASTPRAPARRRINWDVSGKFGPVTGPVAAAGGVLAIGSVGHVAHLAAALGIIIGGLLGLFDFLHAWAHKHTPVAMAYRWAAFVLAGGWLFAAWIWSPWSPWTLVPLGIAGSGMARVAFVAARRRDEAELEAKRQAEAGKVHELDARADDWVDRIVRVGGNKFDGIRICNIKDWPSGDGFTIDGDCPRGGTGWLDLAQIAYQLGVDVPLAKGCEIEVDEGINQRAFTMKVPTRDAFAEYCSTDDPVQAASVLNGLSLGMTRTRDDALISVRESSTIVVSIPGGGKTTLLNRLVLRTAVCTDAVPVVIDMNRAAMGVAWCRAWWNGEAPYPVVAAIAGDAVEADLLTRFLFGVAMGRKQRSEDMKLEHDTTLMPIGNGAPGNPPPLIVPIYDESAELIGAGATPDGMDFYAAQELMQSVMRYVERTLQLARDAGVRPILSALRAVDGFVPSDLMAMCSNRVGLQLPTDADHGNLFGWTASKTQRATPQTVRKGAGWFAPEFGSPTTAFQCPDLTPKQIRQYSIDIARAGLGPWDLTPEDIADGEAFAGAGAWTQRWERAAKWFKTPRVAPAPMMYAPPVTAAMQDEPEDGAAGEPVPVEPDFGAGSMAEAMQDLDAAEAALHAALREADEANQDETADEADADEVARLYQIWSLPSVDPDRSGEQESHAATWQERVLQLLAAAGTGGAAPSAIADQIQREGRWGTNRQTINTWLSNEAKRSDAGDETALVIRASRGRYVHREHAGGADG